MDERAFTIYDSRFTIYDSRSMKLPSLKRFIREFAFSAGEIAFVLLAWGDVRSFFMSGARAGIVVVLLIVPFITYWGKSERSNRGLRSVKGQVRTLALLELGFLLSFLVIPYCDRHNVLVFPESSILRYTGLCLFASGVAIRTWAFLYLGKFFSVFLTIQEGHRLVTENIYSYVRHPSYTGLLIRSLGAALIFRSIIGLFAWLVLLLFLIKRMNYEERVLESEFGAEWKGYKTRTPSRLVPGVY
jgi:protein-S-isoprenylcysteine O-methyltransferase Ste14